jgi:hypothetical protein
VLARNASRASARARQVRPLPQQRRDFRGAGIIEKRGRVARDP